MDKENAFGKKLQQIRKSRGLTQAKLAELAGIHEKHISKLEIGCYHPNYETLNKILNVLDIKFEDAKFDFEKVSANDNPFYVKSMQILNSANEDELEFYYTILKAAQKGAANFKN